MHSLMHAFIQEVGTKAIVGEQHCTRYRKEADHALTGRNSDRTAVQYMTHRACKAVHVRGA